METAMVYRGYVGIMETTIGFRVDGLGFKVGVIWVFPAKQ